MPVDTARRTSASESRGERSSFTGASLWHGHRQNGEDGVGRGELLAHRHTGSQCEAKEEEGVAEVGAWT